MKIIENLKIEKLVFGGQGLAHFEGKAIFVWNALPDEIVDVEILKKKKDLVQAMAIKIVQPSKNRVPALEDHYLSCGPWQIMDYETENFWKVETVKEVYKKFAKVDLGDVKIDFENVQYHYRNKIEYSFWGKDDDSIGLAFFARGQKYRISISDCQLASTTINQTTHEILDWINEQKIPLRSLKTLIVRSNLKGETIAALFIKDELEFEDYPKLSENCLGFQLYYSTHKCPASVPTKLLYSQGQDFLIENVNSVDLKYGLLSFFQVNIPIFEKSLEDIEKFIPQDSSVVDFYSGVGSIGLPLAKKVKDIVLVEENEEAINYAKENIEINNLENCQAHLSKAEKITDLISSNKVIIFDPPRAGLHQNVVDKVLQEKPQTIVYLSCNISTQARDFSLLKENYQIKFFKLYNFFPRTSHVEALLVLEKK